MQVIEYLDAKRRGNPAWEFSLIYLSRVRLLTLFAQGLQWFEDAWANQILAPTQVNLRNFLDECVLLCLLVIVITTTPGKEPLFDTSKTARISSTGNSSRWSLMKAYLTPSPRSGSS